MADDERLDPPPPTPVIVDGHNVIGSVPDGWWRDRPAAAGRLLDRLVCYRDSSGAPVVLVLDVPLADVPEGGHRGIEVRYPPRRGRDAADGRIVELLREDGRRPVEVVTSDRALAVDARALGATVTGARSFLARLDVAGC